jgi:hypothetical protein
VDERDLDLAVTIGSPLDERGSVTRVIERAAKATG